MAFTPRISIVTPSYNQGRFIESAVRSILDQRYPNLQYLVIDAGSTDDTLEVLDRYRASIDCLISEPDHGQSHALNKGFARADGEIFAWLNADDCYLPGALHRVAELWNESGGFDYLFGNCRLLNEQGRVLPDGLSARLIDGTFFLPASPQCVTPQPSSFFSARCFVAAGPLDESLHYAMDVDFWMRISALGLRFHVVDEYFACLRRHSAAKSAAGDLPFVLETLDSLLRGRRLKAVNRIYWKRAVHSCLRALYTNIQAAGTVAAVAHTTGRFLSAAPAPVLRYAVPAFGSAFISVTRILAGALRRRFLPFTGYERP